MKMVIMVFRDYQGIEFDIIQTIKRKKRPNDREEQKIYVIEKRWRDSPYKTIPISVYLVGQDFT